MWWMRWKKLLRAEKCFFSPLKWWKKNFHRYQQDAVKKIFTTKIANLTNIHRANFNAHLIFIGDIIQVIDSCRSGLRSWGHAGGKFLFCKNSAECGEHFTVKNSPHSTLKDAGALRWNKFFSPLFTLNLTLFFGQTSAREILDSRRVYRNFKEVKKHIYNLWWYPKNSKMHQLIGLFQRSVFYWLKVYTLNVAVKIQNRSRCKDFAELTFGRKRFFIYPEAFPYLTRCITQPT